ncbi:acyltransferase domain-containing protein [Ochrobactrum grignonense]|nr:acyltransferase domain-containing protein [Brucella grignonensis]
MIKILLPGRLLLNPKAGFVLTGMGPQWWAMGRELYQSEPVFRSTVTTIDEVFETFAGWSIRHEMLAGETESRMARTEVAQPANFVLQVALVELYKSWGETCCHCWSQCR